MIPDAIREFGIKMIVAGIKAGLRSITTDPVEQRHIFNSSVERARSDLEAQVELDASKRSGH